MKTKVAIIFTLAALFLSACATTQKKPTRTNSAGKQSSWVTPAPYEGAPPGMGTSSKPRDY